MGSMEERLKGKEKREEDEGVRRRKNVQGKGKSPRK